MISLFDKRIKEVIREELDKLILETLSVSQEVVDATDLIIDEAIAELARRKPIKVEYNDVGWFDANKEWQHGITYEYRFVPSEKVQEIVGGIRHVEMLVHTFPTNQIFQAQSRYVRLGARCDCVGKIIQLCFPIIGGNISLEDVRAMLSHELEHMYQSLKMGKDLSSNTYQLARYYMDHGNDLEKPIAWLLYFFNPHELDAKLHEMFFYLCSEATLCSYKQALQLRPYQEMVYCVNHYYKPLMNIDKKVITDYLRNRFKINKTADWFFKYIESQRQYFTMKMRKIYARAMAEFEAEEIVNDDKKHYESLNFDGLTS